MSDGKAAVRILASARPRRLPGGVTTRSECGRDGWMVGRGVRSRLDDRAARCHTPGAREGAAMSEGGYWRLSASELLAGYAAGAFSPEEVVDEALGRIARLNPLLYAYLLVDEAGARQ